MYNYDCIVIGAGVSGMSASIYLRRANLKVLLIEKNYPGGQITRTDLIENYPGFVKISGSDLALSMYEQVNKLGIEYRNTEVVDIIDKKDYKIIKTNKEEITTKYVIIASGRVVKKLGLSNEEELIGKGVGYCAICDGNFYKDKDVAVVGGADGATTGALYLADICRKVYVIFRKESLSGQQYLIDKLDEKKNVIKISNSVVSKLNTKDGYLTSITINDSKKINVSGLFIFIGSVPDTEFVKNSEIKLDNGYILVDSKMETNVENIYACGDVIKKDLYQIVTATSEGSIAASSIITKKRK